METREKSISCIIPAYNEATNIETVLAAVQDHPILKEIIVVDDGSTDDTASVVRRYPFATLLMLDTNHGKALAVKRGVDAASSDIIMLLDADLIGVTEKNITELGQPVLSGNVALTLSIRKYHTLYDWLIRVLGIDVLSGERCFRKEFFNKLTIDEHTAYGLESLINEQVVRSHLPFLVVNFRNVTYVLKSSKIGFVKGILGEFSMYLNILRSVPLHRFIPVSLKMVMRKQRSA